MDLTEERIREEVSLKNKKNAQRPLIEVLEEPLYLQGLDAIEREELAIKYIITPISSVSFLTKLYFIKFRHRIKGNEHFKAQDYSNAIDEYTQSISAHRTAVVINNRAMACSLYIKYISKQLTNKKCLL